MDTEWGVLWIRCHDEAFLLGFAAWLNIWGPNPKSTQPPSHFITSLGFVPNPNVCPRPTGRVERQGEGVGWVPCSRAGGDERTPCKGQRWKNHEESGGHSNSSGEDS